jgi:hypothetical protein
MRKALSKIRGKFGGYLVMAAFAPILLPPMTAVPSACYLTVIET